MSTRAGLLVAVVSLFACRKDAAKQVDASPPPERVTIVDPEEEKVPLANARVNEVKLAYDALTAGRNAEAYAGLKKLGSPRPVQAKELTPLLTVSDTGRALLDSVRLCEREQSAEDLCDSKRDLTHGGQCKGLTLSAACTTTVLDVETGNVLGAYAPYQIAARGKWIVHLPGAPNPAAVLDRDLKPLASVGSAYDFVPAGDAHLVYIDRPLRSPSAQDDARHVRVLDLVTRESTNGCLLTGSRLASQPIRSAGLAANGATLVFQVSRPDGNAVIVCDNATGRTLGRWSAYGEDAWVLGDGGKTLYVSTLAIAAPTVGHPANDMVPVGVIGLLAINAATGEVIGRARIEERLGPPRLAVVPDANLLLLAQGFDLTMLGTKPLTSPPGAPARAGYAPGDMMGMVRDDPPEIRVWSNATFLVREGVVVPGRTRGVSSALRAAFRRDRLYSTKTRAVVWEGVISTLFEDRESKRAGWIARPKTPANGPVVVVVDANGALKTRELPPDFDAGFPPELAGMVDTSRPTMTEIAEKLAPKLCAVGGLYVPRAVCPP